MSPSELPRRDGAVLAYGAANVGNLHRALSDDDAQAVLAAAWDAGIRSFDTAPHYGLGLSERRLGRFLRDKPRDAYTVSTKAGRLIRPNPGGESELDLDNSFHVPTDTRREWDFSTDGIERSLDESLERLGLDRVDALYLHDPEKHDLGRALTDALPAMQRLRASGRVDRIGVGSMDADALATCVRGADLDEVMVAGRYTLLEQPAAADVLPACRERGTTIVAASVFNSGLLSRKTPSADARYEYGGVPDGVWSRLERILDVCRDHGVPLPVAALAFVAREPLVTTVVVGGSRPAQLTQNAEFWRAEVPEAFWDSLARARLIP
jgi:D-threo-aldose 1-dehydrogenase